MMLSLLLQATLNLLVTSKKQHCQAFVTDNSGHIHMLKSLKTLKAEHFSAKSIQGKILSMQLTEHVKPAPKVESVKTYSEDEEATFIGLVNDGSFIEQIAESLGKKCKLYQR